MLRKNPHQSTQTKKTMIHTKTTMALALALALCASALTLSSLQAATLANGDWLQLNFSNGNITGPTGAVAEDYFNSYTFANNPNNSTTGNTTQMIDSQGNFLDLSMTPDNFTNTNTLDQSGWSGIGDATPSGDSTWSTEEINGFWFASSASPATLTIAGLDASLTYNVYFYSKASAGDAGEVTSVSVNGGPIMDPAIRSARYLSSTQDLLFNNIVVTDGGGGLGDLTLSLTSNFDNPLITAVMIQAIPEPSAYALLGGLLALGAVAIRRRR